MNPLPGPRRAALWTLVAVLITDQLTKYWIVHVLMQPPRVIPLTPFFNLVMAWNRGISFGMLSDQGEWTRWVLPALAVIIVGGLLVWLWRTTSRWTAPALGLICGGALGNLVDRMVYNGAVADFLDVHVAGYHWPAFNVADSAITIGAALLIGESLFQGRRRA